MRIRMNDSCKIEILKQFFNGIEGGLYQELRGRGSASSYNDSELYVQIGNLRVCWIDCELDVWDSEAHLGNRVIWADEFIAYVYANVYKSSIKVVRPEKPLSLETLDKRIKKLEQTK